MNKRMLELYQQAHIDYTAIDPSNNMPYKSARFSADRFAELIVQECITVSTDHQCFPKDHLTLEEAFISGQEHTVRCIKQHFGVEE